MWKGRSQSLSWIRFNRIGLVFRLKNNVVCLVGKGSNEDGSRIMLSLLKMDESRDDKRDAHKNVARGRRRATMFVSQAVYSSNKYVCVCVRVSSARSCKVSGRKQRQKRKKDEGSKGEEHEILMVSHSS